MCVEFFNQICRQWDEMSKPDSGKIRFLLEKLSWNVSNRILDVGTGTGVLLPFIREFSPDSYVHAVDISEGMIGVAKQKYEGWKNVGWYVSDIEKQIYRGKFDQIVLYSVFPHLIRKTATISYLVDYCLAEGGELLIAHAQSREFLNHLHRHKDASVSNDSLIEINSQCDIFEQHGLSVTNAAESDEYYYIVIEKAYANSTTVIPAPPNCTCSSWK